MPTRGKVRLGRARAKVRAPAKDRDRVKDWVSASTPKAVSHSLNRLRGNNGSRLKLVRHSPIRAKASTAKPVRLKRMLKPGKT